MLEARFAGVLTLSACLISLTLLGCGDETSTPPPVDDAARFVFEPSADLADPAQFYHLPWPSDARLTAHGAPDVTGFPRSPLATILDGLSEVAGHRPGWPMIPVAYFTFTREVGAGLDLATPFTGPEDPVLLIDVDPDSPRRGELVPVVAMQLGLDAFVTEPMIAVAARPGFVLDPDRTYAFVVQKALTLTTGVEVETAPAFEALKPGGDGGTGALDLVGLYAPLWETLPSIGVAVEDVIAATVFTTGDVVRQTFDWSEVLVDRHDVEIESLALDPDDGMTHERFCELHGTVRFPQFQNGEAPFPEGGLFELGPDGVPVQQGELEAPVVITVPKAPMPVGGYPLTVYFHGSGGLAAQAVDRGTVTTIGGPPEKGKGPSHELAAYGIATAASALPVNPERLPGAGELAYINFDNPKAFPSTFRQGVFEQRLLIEALLSLAIPEASVAGCVGPTLPVGETSFRFAEARLTPMGQSMGGMYANMIGATEPRIEAVVPTGAGGYWSYFLFETSLVPGAPTLLGLLLDTEQPLTFAHPAMSLFSMAWEPAEPMVYMPRLARSPLEGHPARHLYEPVGLDDSYFPTQVFDAMVLAYGHTQVGETVWGTMQDALGLAGLDGLLSYPVSRNLESEGGVAFTGVVVQYEGDGIYDPHAIAFQLDAVKHQYGCFLSTFVETGEAVVVAPGAPGDPCE